MRVVEGTWMWVIMWFYMTFDPRAKRVMSCYVVSCCLRQLTPYVELFLTRHMRRICFRRQLAAPYARGVFFLEIEHPPTNGDFHFRCPLQPHTTW